ncbi:hypothetical protein [Pseudomonas sp. TH32]|nr:hypothetical protein [Pseudomonas sp. TH32]
MPAPSSASKCCAARRDPGGIFNILSNQISTLDTNGTLDEQATFT